MQEIICWQYKFDDGYHFIKPKVWHREDNGCDYYFFPEWERLSKKGNGYLIASWKIKSKQ